MRILSIIAGAVNGGAETFFVNITSALAEAGEQCRAVIRPNQHRRAALEAAGVWVSEAPFCSCMDFYTKKSLHNVITKFQPDIVLSYMKRASAFMPEGTHAKVARLGGLYNLNYFLNCDHLVCITEGIRRYVIDQGWPNDQCSVIYNFAECDKTPALDRASLGVPEEATIIFTPSRLHRVKGLDLLMRAIEDQTQIYLWIAGSGPEKKLLKRLSLELGINDRVSFFGWRRDTGAFFRSCDIVVLPSRYEPFGTVMLEAWAYGKPLIATNTDGPVEFICNGSDGLLVTKDEVNSLRDALLLMIQNNELAHRLSNAGSARHAAEFSKVACIANYRALFRRLLR
ncbi:glycosyl transferases group 1 family protein [Candidatus Endolissoclinum faulkneri L2]|uniref:Glycosyl transferases group 1 family protein n=1 Tax=Candidatus Endolissoclinum faulkneri L2 TaxID=1193729 RepID=K7Z4Q9_9PROT|nr:glycosyltransferase [Candidatus Endolissoclinum faulkneri]AFX98993.1 glycosyl transferases group 1 family protein [Candidatus Endolissoclinum faulkneri L2]